MNGAYFKNPTFPTLENDDTYDSNKDSSVVKIGSELSNNISKKVKLYASFPYANDKEEHVFEGILEHWDKNYVIIRDIKKEAWYYVSNCYINYLEFSEKFDYCSDI